MKIVDIAKNTVYDCRSRSKQQCDRNNIGSRVVIVYSEYSQIAHAYAVMIDDSAPTS